MFPYWVLFCFVIFWIGLITLQENDEIGRLEGLRLTTRWLFAAALGLFVGIYSRNGSLDYENYVDFLSDTPPLGEWAVSSLKDPFFQSLGLVFVGSDRGIAFLTFVTTVLSILIKMKIFDSRYYSSIFGLAMIFLIGRFFLVHEFTQIRASLGIAFMSFSVICTIEKKWRLALLMAFVAAFTHFSTLALLPVVLLSLNVPLKVKLGLLAFIAMVFSAIGIGFETEIYSRLEPYVAGDYLVTENTLLSFYFLFKILVLGTLLFQWMSLNSGMRYALLISGYGLFLIVVFLQNNVLSIRFGELTAVFDCICFAYFLKYSFRVNLIYTYSAGVVISALLYFSSTKIVNPVALTF